MASWSNRAWAHAAIPLGAKMETKTTRCHFKSTIFTLWSRLVVHDDCTTASVVLQSKAGQGYKDQVQWTTWKKNKQKQRKKKRLP